LLYAQSLSISLQGGLRFFHVPIPAFLWVFLTKYLPSREGYGLTMFRLSDTDGLGVACLPVTIHPRIPSLEGNNQLHTFLVKAYQHLWLLCVYGIYQQFTYVHHTTQPGSLSALVLADNILSLTTSDATFVRLRCPGSSLFMPVGYGWWNNRFLIIKTIT